MGEPRRNINLLEIVPPSIKHFPKKQRLENCAEYPPPHQKLLLGSLSPISLEAVTFVHAGHEAFHEPMRNNYLAQMIKEFLHLDILEHGTFPQTILARRDRHPVL